MNRSREVRPGVVTRPADEKLTRGMYDVVAERTVQELKVVLFGECGDEVFGGYPT